MNIPILLYHSISENASDKFLKWSLPPQRFAEHLACLLDLGYASITISQLAEAIVYPTAPLPERVVAITVDDGFADFYSAALPLLERRGFQSTLYITAGYVGSTSGWLHHEGEGDRPMMSWAQAAELTSTGTEVGAHSLHHYQLDLLRREQAYAEIRGSKDLLEQRLGQPIASFAYPHGYYSRETRALVMWAGFTSACAVKHGMSSRTDDPFALTRIIVTREMTAADLEGCLKGIGLADVPRREPLRTTGWRLARRVKSWLAPQQRLQ